MNPKYTVKLSTYEDEDADHEEKFVYISDFANALKRNPEQLAEFLGDVCNSYENQLKLGEAVGKLLQGQHRTLQGSAVRFLLGVLVGLGQQQYTDPRNEKAIQACQQIASDLDSGRLPIQPFI